MTKLVNTSVVLFNHPEYGKRILFEDAPLNPRGELGKNGVTLHSHFSSLFYKTVKINATLKDDKGTHYHKTLYINRNSLRQYLGAETKNSTQLIHQLNAQFVYWNENKQNYNKNGEDLRHAGQHNQRRINHWSNAFVDRIKGSFLSRLYQWTIAGMRRIKLRFLFVGKEQDILEAGEVLAKKRFHEAYKAVPAYQEHIRTYNGEIILIKSLSISL